jgi:predicted amidohydrolase
VKVAVVQMAHGDDLAGNLARARRLLDEARRAGATLALLPEYFFAVLRGGPAESAAHGPALRRFFEDASRETGMAVAGNLLDAGPAGLVNLGVVADGGRLVLEQPKVHPMPREAAAGVTGGPRFDAATVRGVTTGMLVCADILYPEAARVLALQGARILLNPVMSPWRPAPEDPTRAARESLFVARAYDSGAFVLKAGGFRRPTEAGAPAVAGRSLVAAPWGVLARHQDDFREQVLVADLDLDALARFRKGQEGFPARRPEAYRSLVDGGS